MCKCFQCFFGFLQNPVYQRFNIYEFYSIFFRRRSRGNILRFRHIFTKQVEKPEGEFSFFCSPNTFNREKNQNQGPASNGAGQSGSCC